jgi:hypothetical protein
MNKSMNYILQLGYVYTDLPNVQNFFGGHRKIAKIEPFTETPNSDAYPPLFTENSILPEKKNFYRGFIFFVAAIDIFIFIIGKHH